MNAQAAIGKHSGELGLGRWQQGGALEEPKGGMK